MKPKIKFGVLCNGMYMERWQERAILRLLEQENVELSLVIINGENLETASTIQKIKKLFSSNMLFWIYYGFIRNRFKSRKKVDMSSVFSGVSQIVCTPIYKGKYSQYFSSDDIAAIAEHKLDFILRFGFNILRGDILNIAKYGVWSFHHDDEQKYRGGPPCFWEIYRNDKITGAILQRLTEQLDAGIILNKGYFPTINHSYVENLDRTYFSSAEWPAKICRIIADGNDNLINNLPSKTNAPIYKFPDNTQMAEYLLRIAYNSFQYIYIFLFKSEEWNIGIIDKPIYSVLSGNIEPKWLSRPNRGTFIADPFGRSSDGKTFIMVEELDYHIGRANISAIEISNGEMDNYANIKNYTKTSAVELPCHMSYPYIIDYENQVYLIPETYEGRKVVLLKAVDFPNEWVEVATLITNFAAVDSTVFYHDNYWWLMCTNRDTESNSDLYIWFSKNLFGPWKQHSANPVKCDVRSSRPGGTPFVHNGQLYRPTQNSIHTYGGSLVINKVTRLTVDEFQEEEVLEITPDKNSLYNKGIHTLSSMGDKTVIDGKRYVFIPDLLLNRCLRILRRVRVPRLVPRLK